MVAVAATAVIGVTTVTMVVAAQVTNRTSQETQDSYASNRAGGRHTTLREASRVSLRLRGVLQAHT